MTTHVPRRGSLTVLAVLSALVCGAASISVAMNHEAYRLPAASAAALVTVSSATPAAALPKPEVATGPSMPPSWPGSGAETRMSSTERRSEPRSVRAPPSLEPDLVLLGSWTVDYVVGPANGNGANITIPLKRLDGVLIEPGATFDFWRAIGEVSRRTGYRRGAIISGHRVDPDGALAGGICTVSTALFDAAARAGLQITTRTSHSGYLTKYPLGLDAAVAKRDRSRQTMAFRDDTTEPIVIRTVSTPGTARVDLYGMAALDRTVEFSQPIIRHRQKAHDRHVATRTLQRGEHQRVEAASDGMTVVVMRTVADAAGHVLHHDRWVSVYRWLGGTVLDGVG